MIELVKGSDETVNFQFFADQAAITPVDLTGRTVSINPWSDISPVPTLVDAANGSIDLFFSDALSAGLLVDESYRFRLKIVDPLNANADIVTPDFVVKFV